MTSNLNNKYTAIIMILLGIIALAFPLLSIGTIGVLTGVVILLLAAGILINGIIQFDVNRISGIISLIISIILMLCAYQFITNPALVSTVISLLIYIIGIFMIITGVITILSPFKISGIVTLLFGIIVIVAGIFIKNPNVLGTIIAVWLIITGAISLFSDDKNQEIGSYTDI